MSFTDDLLQGVAAALSAAGVGVYDPARVWTAADTAVAIVADGAVPPVPDRVIVLTDYPIADHASQPNSTIGVQLRFRGAPNDLTGLRTTRDAAYQYLQSLQQQPYGTTHVVQFLRSSSVPMGQDANQRPEYADNYYADTELPPGNRTY